MINLDELTENRGRLSSIGRGELCSIINVLLDERRDLLAALKTPKNPALEDVHAARHRDAADAYLNEAEHQLAQDYHELHDSFHGADGGEQPETD